MAQHERPAPSAQPPPAAPENQQPFDVEALAASLPQQAPTSARAARPSKPKEPNPFFTLEGEGGSEAGTDEGGAGEEEGEEDERPADLKEVPVLSINELAPPSPTSANHMSASSATSANSSARAPTTAAARDQRPLGSATRPAPPHIPPIIRSPRREEPERARWRGALPAGDVAIPAGTPLPCAHPPPARATVPAIPAPTRAQDVEHTEATVREKAIRALKFLAFNADNEYKDGLVRGGLLRLLTQTLVESNSVSVRPAESATETAAIVAPPLRARADARAHGVVHVLDVSRPPPVEARARQDRRVRAAHTAPRALVEAAAPQ